MKIKRKVQTMNINWKQKLTSRKFWAAIIGFITAMLVAFGVNDLTIEQVVALITAGFNLDCVYHRGWKDGGCARP